MPLRLPTKLAERGLNRDHAKAINELIEALRRMQPVAGVGQKLNEGPNGTSVVSGSASNTFTTETAWFY